MEIKSLGFRCHMTVSKLGTNLSLPANLWAQSAKLGGGSLTGSWLLFFQSKMLRLLRL